MSLTFHLHQMLPSFSRWPGTWGPSLLPLLPQFQGQSVTQVSKGFCIVFLHPIFWIFLQLRSYYNPSFSLHHPYCNLSTPFSRLSTHRLISTQQLFDRTTVSQTMLLLRTSRERSHRFPQDPKETKSQTGVPKERGLQMQTDMGSDLDSCLPSSYSLAFFSGSEELG